jgi:hypothetical protein
LEFTQGAINPTQPSKDGKYHLGFMNIAAKNSGKTDNFNSCQVDDFKGIINMTF